MSTGVEEAFPHETNFLRYIEEDDISSFQSFFRDIGTFIQTHGPFDGLFGFSEGGGLAAGLVAHQAHCAHTDFQFRCGVLFCAGGPIDMRELQEGNLTRLNVAANAGSLRLPTAHIWDPKDEVHPGFGSSVRELWSDNVAEDVKHELGHSVPGKAGSREVSDTIRAIERTIDRASQ
jgi:hypothetical protein